ncbi:hypothetical protein, partial [Nocardia sp. NPDC004604]|uniref:hypothetical protein n=1 Tax=Nocardia sp. NPDC004604 TaxID=3157013 RepID=UPI0033B92880
GGPIGRTTARHPRGAPIAEPAVCSGAAAVAGSVELGLVGRGGLMLRGQEEADEIAHTAAELAANG